MATTGRSGRFGTGRNYGAPQIVEWKLHDLTLSFRDRVRHIAGTFELELLSWQESVDDVSDDDVRDAVMAAYDAGAYRWLSLDEF